MLPGVQPTQNPILILDDDFVLSFKGRNAAIVPVAQIRMLPDVLVHGRLNHVKPSDQ